jgi:hypothetical protein
MSPFNEVKMKHLRKLLIMSLERIKENPKYDFSFNDYDTLKIAIDFLTEEQQLPQKPDEPDTAETIEKRVNNPSLKGGAEMGGCNCPRFNSVEIIAEREKDKKCQINQTTINRASL